MEQCAEMADFIYEVVTDMVEREECNVNGKAWIDWVRTVLKENGFDYLTESCALFEKEHELMRQLGVESGDDDSELIQFISEYEQLMRKVSIQMFCCGALLGTDEFLRVG